MKSPSAISVIGFAGAALHGNRLMSCPCQEQSSCLITDPTVTDTGKTSKRTEDMFKILLPGKKGINH